jgi:membrane protein
MCNGYTQVAMPRKPDSLFSLPNTQLFRSLLRTARRDSVSLHAMALSYSTIVSIVPFLAVVLFVLKGFGIQQRLDAILQFALDPLGAEARTVARRIVEFISNYDLEALGAVGLAGLLYTTVTLISQLESSINYFWHVHQPRTFREKITDYFSAILLSHVLIVSTLAVAASMHDFWITRAPLTVPLVQPLVIVAERILPLLLVGMACTFLYKLLPNTTVALRSAFFGGIIGGTLWQLASYLFAAFIASSAHYALVYSSFAVVILTLLWLYVSWYIFLLGAELAHVHQSWPYTKDMPEGWAQLPAWRERVGLELVLAVTQRHLSGQPPLSIRAYAQELNMPSSYVDNVALQLLAKGLLLNSAEAAGLVLARPADEITVADVLAQLNGGQGHHAHPT